MIKFVDYARYFMDQSDIPLTRFQAEGGEHLNYMHSRHYYQHTTRHGGKDKLDPHHALLSAMFRKLAYEISTCGNEQVVQLFEDYVKQHTAASRIQAVYRGHRVRKSLASHGFDKAVDYNTKAHAIKQTRYDLFPESQGVNKSVLHDHAFIFVGTIPTHNKRKWTHASLEAAVASLGGKVHKGLPGNTKGRSTKTYYILVNPVTVGKNVPDLVKEGLRRRYQVLSFDYIFTCIVEGKIVDKSQYHVDITHTLPAFTPEPTLHEQHFQKRPRLVSLLKKSPKSTEASSPLPRVEKNAALFYGNVKRKELLSDHQISFSDQARLFGQECANFATLPNEVKAHYVSMWQDKKERVKESLQAKKDLEAYNNVQNPLYKKIR
jgi:hypothetical protein